MFENLLKFSKNADFDFDSGLEKASEHGQLENVNLLLADPRVDPGHNGNKPIYEASLGGNVNVVKCLLQDVRVDPGGENQAIEVAAFNGHAEVVRVLLADPHVNPI